MVHAWDRDIDGAEELYKSASATDPHNGEAMSFVAAARLGKGLKKKRTKSKQKVTRALWQLRAWVTFCFDVVLFFFYKVTLKHGLFTPALFTPSF